MGNVTGAPLIELKLGERATGVLPSDSRGTVPDFDADGTTNARPPVELSSVTGYARVFDGATPTGLEAIDADSLVRVTRSVTVQMIARFDIAAQDAAAVPGTVIAIGFRDASPGEDLQLLVELESDDLATRRAIVRMRWEDNTGALESGNAGAEFIVPTTPAGDDAALLLTIVREWRSDSDVIVRYYAGDLFLGKDNSTDGDIGGELGATITLGNRGDGAGGYENYFEGKLEALAVLTYAMTAEEIRQISRRITIHGPEQYESLKALLPKDVYSTDPGSIVQRELSTEAQMFAVVASKIAELRDDFLPDRAWSFLDRWETVLGLAPRPSDTLAERRNRLLSFLRTVEGFSLPGVKQALEPTFDLDSADIAIVEFEPEIADDFATVLGDYWHSHPADHTIAIVSGALSISALVGVEHRWSQLDSGPTGPASPHIKGSIDRDELDADPSLGAFVTVTVDSDSFTTDDETLIGIAFLDQPGNDLAIVGLAQIAASIRIARMVITGGIEAAHVDVVAAPVRPFDLHVTYEGSGSYRIYTSPVASTNLTDRGTFTGPTNPAMVALGAFGLVAGGPTATESLEFDDFRIFTPNGLRPFSWYAYRDPGLAGTPDIPGANAVVERIKPAHTQAAAIKTLALICDDDGSLCDDGPLG